MLKTTPPPIIKIRSTSLIGDHIEKTDKAINYQVIRLVQFGFATSAISYYTGLTCAQVQNRVRMYRLQGMRSMFRTGQTPNSQNVMKMAMRVSRKNKNEEINIYQKVRNEILNAYKNTARIKS